MIYSQQEKRKIILDNYSNPSKQLDFDELKKVSDNLKIPFLTFRSLDEGCGDIIHILITKKNNYLEKCFFSAQQSCLVTISVANILFSCLEGKDMNYLRELTNNLQNMIEEKEYNLSNCPQLEVFSDIIKFPHRIECIRLVIRGVREASLINN